MKKLLQILFFLFVAGVVGYFIYERGQDDDSVLNPENLHRRVNSEEKDYKLIPRTELLDEASIAQEQWEELKKRYRHYFKQLIGNMKREEVQPVICWMTTEVGPAETSIQRQSKTFIRGLCQEENIPFEDFSSLLEDRKPEEITHMPRDGHLNKRGLRLIAGRLEGIIREHGGHRSKLSFSPGERPTLMGELEPHQDVILDGGKNIPYRLITNASGLRMKRPVRFDNSGQRVLLMGDSGFYFPFVDNKSTPTAILRNVFPDKEVLNVANWAYTLSDYYWQWQERARYLEPDLVLIQSTGDDIADFYFTHQRRFSRDRRTRPFDPSSTEKKFYQYLESKQ